MLHNADRSTINSDDYTAQRNKVYSIYLHVAH